jgi:hypothetical protein
MLELFHPLAPRSLRLGADFVEHAWGRIGSVQPLEPSWRESLKWVLLKAIEGA